MNESNQATRLCMDGLDWEAIGVRVRAQLCRLVALEFLVEAALQNQLPVGEDAGAWEVDS